MKKYFLIILLLIYLSFGNSVFAEDNLSSVSNVIKIQDNNGKILHQYSLENNSDGSINLIFDGNKQTLKEKPQFFFLENGDYFIYYKDNDIYKINYNGEIILYSIDKKLDKIFDGQENLFSRNHFIWTSQKNDENYVFRKVYFVNNNGEFLALNGEAIPLHGGKFSKESMTEEIIDAVSKIKIGNDFVYTSYYSLGKGPASYMFYKGKINKFYGKVEIVTDGENYIFFTKDEEDNTVIYLNMILIYKGDGDGAMKLFNEKYSNYKEIDRKNVTNTTLDEYKNFIKSNLQYLDDMFLIMKGFASSQNQETKQVIQNNVIQQNSTQTNTTNSENKGKYLKQKIFSASKLKKAKQNKYITQIDKLVEKTENKKLTQVFDKIQKLKKKSDIINYLEALIYLKINNKTTEEKNNKVSLVKEAQDFDKINNINRIYGDEKDNNLKGIDTKRNIIWGKQGQDSLYGGKLDDVIIVVGDMSKYSKNDTKQTLEYLGFKIQEINGKNFNISGSPKNIDGGDGHDILFITGDIDLSNTEIIGIEEVIIH